MLSVCLLAVLASACLGGVNTTLQQANVELRNAVDTFDRAIDSLARQSADWQLVLQSLEAAVVDDVQSTVRVELTDLLRTGVLSTGSEFRCDADFLRARAEGELRRIRNDLAKELNSTTLGPLVPLLPAPTAQPTLCSAVPSVVDVSLDPKRRAVLGLHGFDLRSLPITAEVIDVSGHRTDVTNALGILSDTQMVLDLTPRGANLGENARQIALSWNGAVQSVIRVVSPGSPAPTCTTRTVLVPGSPQSFVPPHQSGDREFAGHGPCVTFNLRLEFDLIQTSIIAYYDMVAYECFDDFNRERSDFTIASGQAVAELFRVSSPTEQIVGLDLDSFFSHRYIDNDVTDDLFNFTGTSPVEKLIYVGDTRGDEAGTQTKVDIFFREMRVRLKDCR